VLAVPRQQHTCLALRQLFLLLLQLAAHASSAVRNCAVLKTSLLVRNGRLFRLFQVLFAAYSLVQLLLVVVL
jgi:hypothetical protein